MMEHSTNVVRASIDRDSRGRAATAVAGTMVAVTFGFVFLCWDTSTTVMRRHDICHKRWAKQTVAGSLYCMPSDLGRNIMLAILYYYI